MHEQLAGRICGMKYRIVSDRLMKHGFELQKKTIFGWVYKNSFRKRKVYYDLGEIFKVLEILND